MKDLLLTFLVGLMGRAKAYVRRVAILWGLPERLENIERVLDGNMCPLMGMCPNAETTKQLEIAVGEILSRMAEVEMAQLQVATSDQLRAAVDTLSGLILSRSGGDGRGKSKVEEEGQGQDG